jgi:hypothetical protein
MATKTEVTQFSLVEYRGLASHLAEVAAETLNKREKAMAAFSFALTTEAEQKRIAGLGGLENIQRVRVLKGEAEGFEFEYVLKVPQSVIEAKRRQVERAARVVAAAVAAVVVAKTTKPTKPAKAPLPPEKKVEVERVRFLRSPQGKDAAYTLLQTQERKQDFDRAWQQRRDALRQVKRNVDRKASQS